MEPEKVPETIKCVLVGDRHVGKTCLLISYTLNELPPEDEYVPALFTGDTVPSMLGGELYNLNLFDTLDREPNERFRPLIYPFTDIFLICFSVVQPDSAEHIKEKWIPEISHHCPKTPFILVGTQIDLREDKVVVEKLVKNGQTPITHEQGEKIAEELKAVKYVECSALTRQGLKNVFDIAILASFKPSKKKRHKKKHHSKNCSIS